MIRNLAVSIWIACLTLGSVYFGSRGRASSHEPASAPSEKEQPATIALKTITVPVIQNGTLQGFVQTQISVSAKPDLVKFVPQPADLFLTDTALKTIYAEEQIDFTHIQKQDLAKLSKEIVESINARSGVPIASEVYIQELLYIAKSNEKPAGQSHH